MAAPIENNFCAWLSAKLLDISPDVDVEVFVGYMESILEDDVSEEDTFEALKDFICQVTEDDIDSLCTEIIKKWDEFKDAPTKKVKGESLDEKLAAIMEKNKLTVAVKVEQSTGDREHKAAILRQYAQICDGENTDEDDDDAGSGDTGPVLAKNVNAAEVDKEQRERREKLRQDHEQKKEKDKVERDKQKQKQTDRKDKEKTRTQKGEKRR